MKIAINDCFGGFSLSEWGMREYLRRKGIPEAKVYARDILRNDSDLIAIVEDHPGLADGKFASLKIVEIPNDVDWEIAEYDGNEHVAEKHRTWY